jgi:hypothetical protein
MSYWHEFSDQRLASINKSKLLCKSSYLPICSLIDILEQWEDLLSYQVSVKSAVRLACPNAKLWCRWKTEIFLAPSPLLLVSPFRSQKWTFGASHVVWINLSTETSILYCKKPSNLYYLIIVLLGSRTQDPKDVHTFHLGMNDMVAVTHGAP